MISGCSTFTPPKSRPIIEDKVGKWGNEKIGTLATTPERRVIIVHLDSGKFCAEPSPDTADNIASTLSAALEGNKPEVLSAKAQIASSFASNSKQLFLRSQGVQLYRDGMYNLCQAFVNGAIDPVEYKNYQKELLATVKELIKIEIPELYRTKQDTTSAPTLLTPTVIPTSPQSSNSSATEEQTEKK